MSVVTLITKAAKSVGITAVVTNSSDKLQTQLNRLTDGAELPIMLINWDLTTSAEFDSNGFLENPRTPVTCLLMTKADSASSDEMLDSSDSMKSLFFEFIKALYPLLVPYNRDSSTPPITGASAITVPKHGMGKHSGVLGRWNMISGMDNC